MHSTVMSCVACSVCQISWPPNIAKTSHQQHTCKVNQVMNDLLFDLARLYAAAGLIFVGLGGHEIGQKGLRILCC